MRIYCSIYSRIVRSTFTLQPLCTQVLDEDVILWELLFWLLTKGRVREQDVFDLPFHMARDQIEQSLRAKMSTIKVDSCCSFLPKLPFI